MLSHCSSCQEGNLCFVDSVFTMDVLGIGINLCVLFGEGILFAILTYLLEVSVSIRTCMWCKCSCTKMSEVLKVVLRMYCTVCNMYADS